MGTSSLDGMVSVWRVPEIYEKDLKDPLILLQGHNKKVSLL